MEEKKYIHEKFTAITKKKKTFQRSVMNRQWPSVKLISTLEVSVVLTHTRLHSERRQTLSFCHFSDIDEDVVVAIRRLFAQNTLYQHGGVLLSGASLDAYI